MKRSLSLVIDVLVKLGACLAAFTGCSSKSPGPEKPRIIRWRGEDSGYTSTTAVQPADNGSNADMK
jgi:hypothetical protein